MTEIKGMHQESERKLVESHDKLERTHTDISKQPATLKEDKQCNLSANNNPFIYSVEIRFTESQTARQNWRQT